MSRSTDTRFFRRAGAALVAALGLWAMTPAPYSATVAPHAFVRVEAGTRALRTGGTLRVRIHIRSDTEIASAPFTLLYDPAILEFVPGSSREGRFLDGDGASTTFLARAGAAPGGRTGVVVGLSRLGARRGVRGKGILCVLVFRARAPGVSVLSFTRSSLLDISATPVPADFEGTSVRVRGSP